MDKIYGFVGDILDMDELKDWSTHPEKIFIHPQYDKKSKTRTKNNKETEYNASAIYKWNPYFRETCSVFGFKKVGFAGTNLAQSL